MHRGIARRTVFENRADMRFFLALLVREVRAGWIALHAYSLLHTHLHLLLTSLTGELWPVMRRVFSTYARRFNRQRRRDGALFRHRFTSKRVETRAYRSILHRYLDDNPVVAGLAEHAAEYPYGSARFYARPSGPIWLDREWAEQEAMSEAGDTVYRPELYPLRFPSRLSPAMRELVERRLLHGDRDRDELADLIGAPPDAVRAWMVRKARLADGTRPFAPLIPASWIKDWGATHRTGAAARTIRTEARYRRSGWCTWEALVPGLLRDLAGLTLAETALHLRLHPSSVRRRLFAHQAALVLDPHYADCVAELTHVLLARLEQEAGTRERAR